MYPTLFDVKKIELSGENVHAKKLGCSILNEFSSKEFATIFFR